MKPELDNLNLPFMAKSMGPPWLPAPVVGARELAWWTQWALALLGILFIISGIISFFTIHNPWAAFWAGYILACGAAYFFLLFIMKPMFFDVLDQGRFKEASDRLIILVVIGLFVGVIPAVLLALAYIRMREVFQPNYQPYPAGTYQAGAAPPPPPQPQYAPPPQQAPSPPPPAPPAQSSPPEPQKHAEMVKCKKCGVQYPSFMRTCPNCNEPR